MAICSFFVCLVLAIWEFLREYCSRAWCCARCRHQQRCQLREEVPNNVPMMRVSTYFPPQSARPTTYSRVSMLNPGDLQGPDEQPDASQDFSDYFVVMFNA